jgi:diguanylate cyclase (GGDEF)-like protein
MPIAELSTMSLPATTAAPPTPRQVDALNQRAFELRHSDARAALALARQAHQLALQLDYQRGLAWALLRTGVALSILAEDDAGCESMLQQAVGLMRGLGDLAGEAEALNQQGVRLRYGHDPEAALACYQRVLALRRQIGDLAGEAAVLHNIALLHRDQGRFADALEQAYLSQELARQAGECSMAAYAHTNLALLLQQVGEPQAARAQVEQALEIVRQTDDRAHESTALVLLASLLLEAGAPAAALPHLQAAQQLSQATGNLGDQAEVLLGLGRVRQALGAHAEAQPALARALSLARQRGDGGLAAQVLVAQATTPLQRGEPRAALPLLQQALAHAQAGRREPLVAQAHECLSQAHEAAGDLALALLHARAFHASRERQHDQAQQRRIRMLMHRQELARARDDAEAERRRSDELARALDDARRAELDRAHLLAEVQAQAELLQQLAREDGLTGLANRRWLDLQLQRESERARRFEHPLALAMIDVDHFKAVNDDFSHAVGDEVLRVLARLLRDGCRGSDVVGRFGGEEFMILFVETSPARALEVCNKLRERVEAHDWRAVHPAFDRLTVSIGVAGFDAGLPQDGLVALADQHLYRAKHEGRNRVCG